MFIVVDCWQDNTTKKTDEGGEGTNAIRNDMLRTNYFSPARCSFFSHRSSLFLVHWVHLVLLAAIAMTRVGRGGRGRKGGKSDGMGHSSFSLVQFFPWCFSWLERKEASRGCGVCVCVSRSHSLSLSLHVRSMPGERKRKQSVYRSQLTNHP